MYKYVLRRLLYMIPVLLGITFVIFTLLYFTPGDPVLTILGEDANMQDVQKLRAELGLDLPFLTQYFNYLGGILFRGDFGLSYATGKPVAKTLLERFPTTITLASVSMILGICLAIPLGILSATHQDGPLDFAARIFALFGVSMPAFWQGMLLILFFAVYLGVLPSSGFYGPQYWILPSLTIALHSTSSLLRTTRSSMLETIRQDYVRTVRAKGASDRLAVWKHALSNAMIPVLTIIGIRFGNTIGGSIVTESIFGIPGIGKLMIDSIKARDYPVVQGGVLLVSLAYCMVTLLVDILYAYVDPRIKSRYAGKQKTAKKEAAK